MPRDLEDLVVMIGACRRSLSCVTTELCAQLIGNGLAYAVINERLWPAGPDASEGLRQLVLEALKEANAGENVKMA